MRPRSCIGNGKAHRPYEFGVKVSIATTLHRWAGGQFIARAKGLPGNPYEGHTLATVISEIETQIASPASSPTAAIAATASRLATSSGSISLARDAASPKLSNASRTRRSVDPVIGPARVEHRTAETTSPEPTATPPTPSLPCSNGWLFPVRSLGRAQNPPL
jgi:IS5 family transposase